MFIPRTLFASAYAHLKAHAHPSTSSVLILCALDTDSLCGARILAALLKRDYILHQIKPVAGYQDLEKVNETLVRGNDELRFVICLGLGGLVDLASFLDLARDAGDEAECWIVDGRRPWNLYNVYAGGIKCFDDGDILEEMAAEGEAHTLLSHPSSRPLASSPPPLNGNSDLVPTSPSQNLPNEPPLPPYVASTKTLRRKLRKLRRKHEAVIANYYSQGTWYGEPVSSLMYSLAADLGREDNDILWLSIVGVCAGETYGRTISSGPPRRTAGGWGADTREDQVRGILKDEVRRLNPPDLNGTSALTSGNANGVSGVTALQTTARSPSDTSIRISPEYRFMLIRHWSLYDSMLHSSYLGTKLHIWSEHGRKRLHKLLAKMGFSLSQCKQHYTHMDMDLKRSLKEKLEKYAPLYGLDGIVKEGFVRCWGWRGCLSAADVAYVVGGILEVGKTHKKTQKKIPGNSEEVSEEIERLEESKEIDEWITNFWDAYDALTDIEQLKSALPVAMNLHQAILRTGTALIEKRQIRLLRSFRLAVVKEGPDLPVFTHPNALSKLALWISEAIIEQERESSKKKHLPLVVASLNERRNVYTVVGTALGLEEDDSDDEDEEERKGGRNRFGIAFQEVANSTQARIRIDSFEATVVEVKQEDLGAFLEGLSLKSVSLQ
ncbi:CDC45 family [Pyronema omphalodes]|nr:CDC45 family [Pyronema omphalodes]